MNPLFEESEKIDLLARIMVRSRVMEVLQGEGERSIKSVEDYVL